MGRCGDYSVVPRSKFVEAKVPYLIAVLQSYTVLALGLAAWLDSVIEGA